MKRCFYWVIVSAVISSLFLFSEGVYAQDVTALEKEVETLQTEVQKLQTQSDEYQFLKEQIKDFKDSVKTEMQNYRSFVEGQWNKFITFLYLVGGLGIFFLGASSWEFRKRLREKAEQEYEEIRKKAIEEFQNQKIELEKEIINKWQQVKDEVAGIEKETNTLKNLILYELRYKEAQVLVMGSEKDLNEMKKYMDPAMGKRGLQEPIYLPLSPQLQELQTVQKDHIKQKLEEAEIIVYCYESMDNKKDLRMEKIINFLIQEGLQTPVFIYTGKNWAKDDEKVFITDNYTWHIFANTPATLLGHIFTFIHATREGRDERDSC